MKLLLLIALVAIVAVVLMSVRRGGTRITRIDHRRDREDDDA